MPDEQAVPANRRRPGAHAAATARELHELMLGQVKDQALVLLDPAGKIVDWLMGAQVIFGYERSEIVGRGVDILFTPEDRELGIPADERAMAAQQERAEDDRWMLRKDGVRFWVTGFLTALYAADGRLSGFAKVLRDRTDLRAHIESLRNRSDSLAAEDQRRTLMLAKLAHELRNPLGVLVNGARAIEDQCSTLPELADVARMVGRQALYLGGVIDNLVEVARTGTGKGTLHTERVDLQGLLREAIEIVRPLTDPKRLGVEMTLPAAPLVFEGDRVRLKQVFINLLSNAAKFSESGTRISVRCLIEAGEVVVHVRDRGRGIPPEWLPRIFELFTQAEPAGQGGSAGLGLGLAVVKECVELHGGTVQVRSEGMGRGSEFTVRLPFSPHQDAA